MDAAVFRSAERTRSAAPRPDATFSLSVCALSVVCVCVCVVSRAVVNCCAVVGVQKISKKEDERERCTSRQRAKEE